MKTGHQQSLFEEVQEVQLVGILPNLLGLLHVRQGWACALSNQILQACM